MHACMHSCMLTMHVHNLTISHSQDDANNTLHTFKNKAAEVKDVATKKVVNMAVITTDLASEGMERAQIGLLKAGDLTKISLDASKKYWAIGKDYALVGFEQISEASKPHIEQGVKTTKNLYDSHVKDIVDEKVAPVYKEKVAPHFQLASEKIVEGWEVASPKVSERRGGGSSGAAEQRSGG